MKIYEIISESNQVDEGFVDKTLAWLGSKAANSATARSAMLGVAEKWANILMRGSKTGKNLTLTPDVIRKLAPKDAKRLLSDPKYVKAIEKEAAKINRNKNISSIANKVGMSKLTGLSKWDLAKTVGGTVAKIYTTWQIAGFFYDYNSNVNAWDAELKKQLAAKEITQEQYDAQIEHIRKTEMGLLITKVGAGLLGSALAKGTVAPLAFVFNKIPFLAPVGSIMTGLGTVGSAYVYSKLNSKEGSEMVAKVMVGNALGDTVTSTLGNAGTSALDWLTGTAKKGQELDQQKQPAPTDGSSKPTNSTSGQGASTTPVAAPAAATVMPGDNKTASAPLDTPAGFSRDANGNLILN